MNRMDVDYWCLDYYSISILILKLFFNVGIYIEMFWNGNFRFVDGMFVVKDINLINIFLDRIKGNILVINISILCNNVIC